MRVLYFYFVYYLACYAGPYVYSSALYAGFLCLLLRVIARSYSLCIPPIGNRHRRLLLTRDIIPHVVSILLLVFCARDFNERDSSSISSVFDTDISSYYYLYYPISTYLAAKSTFSALSRSFSCISQKKVVTLREFRAARKSNYDACY